MMLGLAQIVAVVLLLEFAVFEVGLSQDDQTGGVVTTKKTLKKLLAGEITKALDDFTCSVPTTAPYPDHAPSLSRIEETVERLADKLDAPDNDTPFLSRIEGKIDHVVDHLDALNNSIIESAAAQNVEPPSLSQIKETVERIEDKLDAPSTDPPPPSLSRIEETVERIEVRVTPCSEISLIQQTLTRLEDKIDNLNDDITLFKKLMNELHQLGSNSSHPATSCAEILRQNENSSSGYYWVKNATDHHHNVYCDMTRSCGGVTGGWMRVAYLDMTNNNHQCPSALRQRIDSGLRTCAPYDSDSVTGTCSSVSYPFNGIIHYSKVCGKIRAYFENTLDGFNYRSIDDNYVDGVSLTHGRTPRHHIWTFAGKYECPCNHIPPFVGSDYFCDGRPIWSPIDPSNPIWDGENCGSNTCCTLNNPPWFYRQLPQPTTDDIEMRVCRNQARADEDIAIEVVEIYVQ